MKAQPPLGAGGSPRDTPVTFDTLGKIINETDSLHLLTSFSGYCPVLLRYFSGKTCEHLLGTTRRFRTPPEVQNSRVAATALEVRSTLE